jgi:hypothetical protein
MTVPGRPPTPGISVRVSTAATRVLLVPHVGSTVLPAVAAPALLRLAWALHPAGADVRARS